MMSACSVLCSGCPAFHARDKGPAFQKSAADAWRRIYGLTMPPDDISCGGCQRLADARAARPGRSAT